MGAVAREELEAALFELFGPFGQEVGREEPLDQVVDRVGDDVWRDSAAWLRDDGILKQAVWTQQLDGMVGCQFIGSRARVRRGCVLAQSRDSGRRGSVGVQRRPGPVCRRGGRAGQRGRRAVLHEEPARQSRRVRIRAQVGVTGAPGIVASLAQPRARRRRARSPAARGWRAHVASRSACRKGANLCHGTCGQRGRLPGARFERTGRDELWLERARAFAMHSVAQVARARREFGRGRHTLWTGDPGTALYLADCLAGGGSIPLP